MNARPALFAALAALTVASAVSNAQIAPPPPDAAAPTPAYERKPLLEPTGNPAAARKTGPIKLPDLPYESLVTRDADGKVIRLKEPATWLACRRNPTISPDDWTRLEPIFAERRAECETIVVSNLDLIEKVEAGELRNIKGDAKTIIQTINRVYAPLKPSGGNFSNKLGKEGILTDVQSSFSQKIESEYNTALRAEASASSTGKKENDQGIEKMPVVFQVYLEQIDETYCTYHALLAETARSLDRALPAVDLPADLRASIEPDRKAVAAATDDASRAAALRTLLDKLTLQQRRALLAKVIETRPKN